MSRLPRKKSRPITVGDVSYRWMFRGYTRLYGDAPKAATVTVQVEAEKPGPVLQASVVSKKRHDPDFDLDWWPHRAALKPFDVQTLILAGLAAGWDPHGPKQTAFKLAGPVDAGEYEVV